MSEEQDAGSMPFQKTCLMMSVTLCFMHVFVLQLVYCDSKHYNYERTEQLLLQTGFKTIQNMSVVGCCAYCSHTTGCESLSFKPSDGECRLSSVQSVAIQQDGTPSPDWNTYNRKDGKITAEIEKWRNFYRD